MGVFIFLFFVSDHHPIDYLIKFKYAELHALVVFAPCVIFGLTVDAYYHFITRYRGPVSGFSFFFFLLALLFCSGLVEKRGGGDWWGHLMYMYLLFCSFVVWDIIMIEWLLTPSNCKAEVGDLLEKDKREVKLVSYFINMPTLVTIFVVSRFCAFCLEKNGAEENVIMTFVAGVISFHLIFSSAAYIFVRLRSQDS
jgi:hypothetical protein